MVKPKVKQEGPEPTGMVLEVVTEVKKRAKKGGLVSDILAQVLKDKGISLADYQKASREQSKVE